MSHKLIDRRPNNKGVPSGMEAAASVAKAQTTMVTWPSESSREQPCWSRRRGRMRRPQAVDFPVSSLPLWFACLWGICYLKSTPRLRWLRHRGWGLSLLSPGEWSQTFYTWRPPGRCADWMEKLTFVEFGDWDETQPWGLGDKKLLLEPLSFPPPAALEELASSLGNFLLSESFCPK